MAILLLANIGNSDLWLSGTRLKKQREEAKLILDDFETMCNELTIPILEPIIKEIWSTHKRSIDEIILFSTDQPISAGKPFHANDTIYSAQVIRRLLLEDERFADKVSSVVCAPPITSAPNDLDATMQWFAQHLPVTVAKEDFSDIYVSVTGGTPAMNQAIFFHALYSLKGSARRQLIYTSESGGVKLPGTLGEIDKEFQLARVRSFLERYNYSAVLEILHARDFKDKKLLDLISACDLRLNFRLDDAQQKVGKWRPVLQGELSRYFIRLDEQIKLLLKGISDLKTFHKDGKLTEGIKAVFVELFHNMRLLYETGRYVDMMARLFRLQEGLLRLLCEQKLGFDTSIRDSNQFREKALQAMSDSLKVSLQQQARRIRPQKSRMFYQAVIDFYSSEFEQFRQWNERVNPLVDERNRMIIGHEFDGASKSLIKEKYQGSDLIVETGAMLRKVLQLQSLDFDLPAINDFIFHRIRRDFE